MMMTAKQQLGFEHVTLNINKSLKNEIKKKIIDYNKVYIKDCVEAGLILILDKDENDIRKIIDKYSKRGGD